MARPRKTAPLEPALAHSPPRSIEQFLQHQRHQDLLRFITCGSVDDGKSTLIGRLLWEAQQVLDDQLATLRDESRRHGTQGEAIDFALLVDGLSAEREQGITIDVAYRYFSTDKRKFIVADTPGHEQYTRNMVTGASTAELAVLLVDARAGLLTQTRRHAYLSSLMGVRQVVLAVNKMDLVEFRRDVFDRIRSEFEAFAQTLKFDAITPIPLSALQGDNMIQRSARTPWYVGPTLMGCLETARTGTRTGTGAVMPVQWVNRPNSEFRGFSGTIASGRIAPGDELRVTATGEVARVSAIVTMDEPLDEAVAGQAVTLCLDREVDISRGDVLTAAQTPAETTDQFEATLVWMNADAGLVGRSYDIKLATQWASASITTIKHRININTLQAEPSTQLQLNDISVCTLALSRPLAFDTYESSRTLGGFILVDRFSHATIAAGMIRHTLRRAHNVHRQSLSVGRVDRERLNGHRGQVIWFTGLSGSGKSTIANALEVALHAAGRRTYILDGDNIRQGLNKDLGFTAADRVENIRRIAEVARLMMDAGLIVLTAFISPFRQEREMARELIGPDRFSEVFVDTDLAVCEQRDVKGLYRKARAGLIPNMTGINSPYEAPLTPDLKLKGDQQDLSESVRQIMELPGLKD